MLKESNVPIIFICNSYEDPKLRNIVSNCYKVKFTYPHEQIVLNRIWQICDLEDIKIKNDELLDLIIGSGWDMRKVLNNLQMLKTTGPSSHHFLDKIEALKSLISPSKSKHLSLREKQSLFFDPIMISEGVFENYLDSFTPNLGSLQSIQKASESIALSDIILRSVDGYDFDDLREEFFSTSTLIPCS
mgnify:CR=1 FL=1